MVLGADPAALLEDLSPASFRAPWIRGRRTRRGRGRSSSPNSASRHPPGPILPSYPDALALSLGYCCSPRAHPSAPIAAVLLRRLIVIAPSFRSVIYPALSPATQYTLRAVLLSAACAPALYRSI